MSESNFEQGYSPAFLQARDTLLGGETISPSLLTLLTEQEREELLTLARLSRFTHAALQANIPPEGAEEIAWQKAQKALSNKQIRK